MIYCPDHQQFYHGQIESCSGCLEKQENCAHTNQGPDKLFNSLKYAGLEGEYNTCYDCGKLIRI